MALGAEIAADCARRRSRTLPDAASGARRYRFEAMADNESQSGAPAERDAPQEHPANLAKHRSKVLFETLVLRLGCGHSHADFVKFFDARCTINQVIDWRRGRARIPGWAWTYLGVRLRARAETDLDYARQTDAADRQRRANNIAKFNRSQAALQAAPIAQKKEGAT